MSNPTTTAKPKRERKPAGPMTPTKAIATITRIRDKAIEAEDKILKSLEGTDRARVAAFLSVENA